MSDETTFGVRTFEMGTHRESALKPLEEAAEVFGAWQDLGETRYGDFARVAELGLLDMGQRMRLDRLADEIADCVQACCNLAARYGIDMGEAMRRCETRNRERGRYA